MALDQRERAAAGADPDFNLHLTGAALQLTAFILINDSVTTPPQLVLDRQRWAQQMVQSEAFGKASAARIAWWASGASGELNAVDDVTLLTDAQCSAIVELVVGDPILITTVAL